MPRQETLTFESENMTEREQLPDINVDGRLILKSTLNKWVLKGCALD
jgi:hypothetical protein